MNRAAATEYRASALKASGTFPERHVAPFCGIESAFDQIVVGVGHQFLAMCANDAHQALSQNAIEGSNEIVGFHAHVQKAAQDIQDVIGVNGGEYQVACERGVDGDFRSPFP